MTAARESNATQVLDAALALAGRGIPVFPCKASTDKAENKRPLAPHGFKDASRDPEQIREWWRRWPKAMIGVPTGAVSGLVALDVDQDPDDGLDGEAGLLALVEANGQLPHTPVQVTPRGGRHVLFRHPGREVKNSASKLAHGLDVRGDGGYICIAPSSSASGK